MTEYYESQIELERKQRICFLLLAVFGLGAYVFLPLGAISVLALLYYWVLLSRILSAKCPNCGAAVGKVQPRVNNSCRKCGLVLVDAPPSENGVNQNKW